MPDPLEAAKTFMDALEARDPERAAAVCSENVQIELPGVIPSWKVATVHAALSASRHRSSGGSGSSRSTGRP